MDVTAWFKSRAVPVLSFEPRSGFADIEPLRSVLGNARIVSLGEATHGTREFFQLKHRLLEYCVSVLGFTIFGIEASFPECLAINEYVQTGRGDAAQALTGTRFWVWNTEEVLELIEWMRWWNTHHEPKVMFFGFDMQFPTEAVLGLLDYLDKVDPELAKACQTPLAPLVADFAASLFPTLPQSQKDAALACVGSLNRAFAERETAWVAETGRLEYQIARLHAQVLEQSVRMRANPDDGGIRDRSMADNVRTVLQIQGPNAKAVLWAHNNHVGRDAYAKYDIRTMGDHLDEYYGRQYLTVGFVFNQGSFQARRRPDFLLVNHTVPAAPAGSLDATLASVGEPAFAIDLTRISPREPIADWLASRPLMRDIGAVYSEQHADEYMAGHDPRKTFDILLFVESTTAARPNPSVVRELERRIETAPHSENLSLTANETGIPFGWHVIGAKWPFAHEVALSPVAAPGGNRCVCISRKAAPWRWGDGELVQQFSAERWRGKRLRFKAAIRCQADGYGAGAQLFIETLRSETDAEGSVRRQRTLSSVVLDRQIQSNEWESHSVESDIPNEAEAIRIGLVASGCATAWFGELELSEHRDP